MHLSKIFLLICVLSFVSIGCETTKGMKKDVSNFVEGTYASDGWAKKTDNWMREHMW